MNKTQAIDLVFKVCQLRRLSRNTAQTYAHWVGRFCEHAMAELKTEQQKHADANAEVHRYAQSLIDAVELGKFEDGAEPIKLMEGYAPKAPTKPAKAR